MTRKEALLETITGVINKRVIERYYSKQTALFTFSLTSERVGNKKAIEIMICECFHKSASADNMVWLVVQYAELDKVLESILTKWKTELEAVTVTA